MSTPSAILKSITGVLLIEKNGEDKLVCIEDLRSSKHFSIGQLFNAIRVLNNKTVQQYGAKWPRSDVGTECSNDWLALKAAYKNSNSDYEFLIEVCNQLQETVHEVVEREKVLKKLEKFRHGNLVLE